VARPLGALRAQLKGVSDVERITARIALRQVRPRELVALRKTLQKAELLAHIAQAGSPIWLKFSATCSRPGLRDLLRARHAEEPAALVRDGGVIAPASTPSWTSCAPSRPTATPSCSTWKRASGAHRHPQPARAVQQGARLLHRGDQAATWTRCPTTTAAARR
jgi:hypothetical protein